MRGPRMAGVVAKSSRLYLKIKLKSFLDTIALLLLVDWAQVCRSSKRFYATVK
jgi:hypothetical protein